MGSCLRSVRIVGAVIATSEILRSILIAISPPGNRSNSRATPEVVSSPHLRPCVLARFHKVGNNIPTVPAICTIAGHSRHLLASRVMVARTRARRLFIRFIPRGPSPRALSRALHARSANICVYSSLSSSRDRIAPLFSPDSFYDG